MNTWVIILIIFLALLIVPQGRRVILLVFGLIYLPLQLLFLWLQKVNLGLKDKNLLLFYLSCIIIYPLYAIIIGFSKAYEAFQETMH